MRTSVEVGLLLLGLTGMLGFGEPLATASDSCTIEQLRDGSCSVSGTISGGEVVLEGGMGSPGSPGAGGDRWAAEDDPDGGCVYVVGDRCYGVGPGKSVPVQPVTLADIVAFRPDAGVDRMEPDGWMIVGLDTNFYASSDIQVRSGTLLGQPASVRFTPVAWYWTYGDGTGRSSSTPGATWAALGVGEFDPTSTSHVYRAPGRYVIELSIDFAAEYRFATGAWVDIPGVLNVPANPLTAVAGYAKTVLVERDCTLDPTGPGC